MNEKDKLKKAIEETKLIAKITGNFSVKTMASYGDFTLKLDKIVANIQPFENSTYNKSSYLFLEQLNQLADDFIKEYIPKDKEE